MSRRQARAGVVAWLGNGAVPGLGTVYRSGVKVARGSDFTVAMPPGSPSGAVGVVFIASESEDRIALGGAHSGWKRVDYTIEFHIFHRSNANDPEVAMDAFDDLVEAVKDRIRADRTFGGVFWQAGESRLSGEYGDPILAGQITQTWGMVTFVATEMIQT